MEKKIKPSDLRKEAEALIREGRMPSLDKVLQVVSDTRRIYVPQILAARAETKRNQSFRFGSRSECSEVRENQKKNMEVLC